MTRTMTAADRLAAGEVRWTGRFDGASNTVHDLYMPCGCRWTANGVSLLSSCRECLSEALRAEAQRMAS